MINRSQFKKTIDEASNCWAEFACFFLEKTSRVSSRQGQKHGKRLAQGRALKIGDARSKDKRAGCARPTAPKVMGRLPVQLWPFQLLLALTAACSDVTSVSLAQG